VFSDYGNSYSFNRDPDFSSGKGDEIAVIEPVELTEGETFAAPSPAEVLLVSGGVIFVGWLRRRKMGDHIPR